MTTTIPPNLHAALDRLTSPASRLLDDAEAQLEAIGAALEYLQPKRSVKARDMQPVEWVESAVAELEELLGQLRNQLEASR